MDILREFLESSTIHGLTHIYTARVSFVWPSSSFDLPLLQTKLAKILWFLVVCFGFIGAGILIGKSYKEWQENPIATSITTHPIDDLDFPIVTVCPPKDSNTALYHDLIKAGNGTLSDENRKTLKKAAFQIFMEQHHKDYIKKMLATSYMMNMNEVLQGFHSLPKPINHTNSFEIKMWNLNGTITTPWFGEDYVEEFYKEDRDFLVVLELPGDIKDQVGSGSLIIELEVDSREEVGWIEDVSLYNLHKRKQTWLEAEAECQREGGYLPSVRSEEVNEMVGRVGGVDKFWLGGVKRGGEWNWSDNSTWGFTKWDDGQPNGRDSNCIYSYEGWWYDDPCTKKYRFICQKTKTLKGKKTMNLAHTKDQLNFSSFHVWYKYKAASQQLLDSWKDKRTTGFKLSWRVENPTLTWTTSIDEVGKSIQTPLLGDTFVDAFYASSNQVYKAILALPKDLEQEMGNNSLMIELDIDMKKLDEMNVFTSYKLYNEYKTWADAEAYCKSEGGQLASIHSKWEQALAKQAADGHWVWLGGRKVGNEWAWADNSTWSFTNWMSGSPHGKEYLRMEKNGQWYDYAEWDVNYFLCQGKTAALAEKGLVSIELEKEQLHFFPYHMLFKSQRMLNNSPPEEERGISGFTLNWFLEDRNGSQLTKKVPPRQEDWTLITPKYKQPWLAQMVGLAHHFRTKQNMTRGQILEKVVQEKIRNNNILNEAGTCSMDQIKPQHLDEAFLKLVPFIDQRDFEGSDQTRSDEDTRTGFAIFHAIVFCPIQLYHFVDQLLSFESSRTIIQAYVNLFHTKVIKDKTMISLMKEFYEILATTLNLEYGNILLATSTKSQLQAVIDNDWPFFTNNTDLVKICLLDSDCGVIQDIIQDLGIEFYRFLAALAALYLPLVE